MLYDNIVNALSKSIVFKNIWVAFGMNTLLKEKGLPIPDNKREWRYFKHLAGDKHHLDDEILIVSLDTEELVPLNKQTISEHRKTATFYRDRDNREKLHNMYPEYSIYIDSMWEAIPYEVSINAEEGKILRYDSELIEPQEISLIPSLEEWFKGEVHLYFMESFAAQYPLFITWFEAKISAFLPSEINRLRYSKLHTVETHSFFIGEFLKSHKYLDKYIPYLSFKQKIFLYRNIRYIERHAARNDTFEFLIENLLTNRSIPIDGFDLGERNINYRDNILKREVVGYRTPLNFKNRIQGRDFEVVSIDDIIDLEINEGVLHDRLLEDYRVESHNIINRERVLSGPTKLLQVTGVDPNSIRSDSLIERLVYDWAYFSTSGEFNIPIDLVDPQSGNNVRLSPHTALCVFFYALFKGYHDVTLETIPPFNVFGQETGEWYNIDFMRDTLPNRYSVEREHILNYFVDNQPILPTPYDDSVGFLTDVKKRWDLKSEREAYIASQYHDLARLEAEVLFNHIYKTHYIKHDLSFTSYRDFMYELGFNVERFTVSMWQDLCADLLKLTVGYDPENTIGFNEIQKNLVELFVKLSGYSIQVVDKTLGSESITMEPVAALVTNIITSSSSIHNAFYESSLKVESVSDNGVLYVNGTSKMAPVLNQTVITVKPLQDIGCGYSVTTNVVTTPYYESSSKVILLDSEGEQNV